MTRWIWIGALAAGGVLVAYLLWQPQPLLVSVTAAEKRDVEEVIPERAKTRLPEIYRITMPLDGRIERITLHEGTPVKAGQLLAQMDPADLQTDLDAAESRVSQFDKLLSSMDLVVAAATEQISASDAKFKYAEKEYRRKSGLAERKAVSPSELDAADLLQFESRVDWRTDQLTEQALKAMRNALSVARNEVDETRKQEQRDRDRAEIYSPVDGVVLKRIVSNRQVLAAGDSLLEIGNLRELEVEVEALTQEAARIEVGDRVEIVGAAVGDRRVGGTVRRIYPQGFKKISSLGVEQQRVLVIVAFDEGVLERLSARGIRLQSDYRLRVRIITDVHRDVVRIPRSAVFRDQEGRWQAFVVQGGIARRVTLEVGIINDFDVEVVKGISAGESVVVAPESALEDGMRVEAVKNSDRKRGA